MTAINIPDAAVSGESSKLTPNPIAPIVDPIIVIPKSGGVIADPVIFTPESGGDISVPVIFTPENIGVITSPFIATPEDESAINTPFIFAPESIGSLDLPVIFPTESIGVVGIPSLIGAVGITAIAPPVITAPENIGIISTPVTVTPESEGVINTPVTATPENEGVISNPLLIASESDAVINAPVTVTPESEGVISAPVIVTPENIGAVVIPSIIAALSIGSLSLPVAATPENEGVIVTPSFLASESIGTIGLPSIVAALNIGTIAAPIIATAENEAVIVTPVIVAPESVGAIISPAIIAANALDPNTPPFALNHARILYENLLTPSTATATSGTNPSYTLLPNTFQSWEFTNIQRQEIEFSLPANVNIDTICIGAHNLSGSTIEVDYSPDAIPGVFNEFAPDKSPTTNDAIMFHISSSVSIRHIRIGISVPSQIDCKIGWITAGISLQMARPFFSGHNPMNQNKKHRYFDAWTETGNMVGRSKRSVQLEGDFSWGNLPDSWYRTYMPAFIESATQLPYVIAWNLLEYPDDVAMAFTDEDISSTYSGTRNLRSLSFSARGIA